MKILVTGAAGSLGRDLAPLLSRYYDVRALDIRNPNNSLEFVQCDISKLEEVEQALLILFRAVHELEDRILT